MSTTARDHKRDRVETTVAAARVRDSARLADPVIPALHASHPRWGPGSTVQGLDGTHVSATEHRLTVWRGTSAAPWPGPACVGLDPQRMLSTDVVPREAGPAQERRMIDQGLSRVRAGEVWIEDRHFCTRRLLCGMARRGAAFLGRQQAQWPGERRGSPTRTGVVRSGTVYAQAMLVHDLARGETMRVRRLTLALKVPTRDGATEIHLLSNIPVEEARARTLVGVYGKRWTIETAFLDLTTPLACEINTLGYPKAALCAFCLALVADHAVSIMQAALRRAHGQQQGENEVSRSALALAIRQTYDGMMIAIPAPHWAVCREMSAAECAGGLCELASSAKLSKYRNHPRGPKKKPPERTAYKNGSHVSTARLIAQR